MKMTRLEKIERYQEVKRLIPVSLGNWKAEEGQVLDWLVQHLHCSRSTAKKWNMADSPRPMPDAKLKIMEHFLINDSAKVD